MKTVYLLRHGKSDWNAEFETDHERPINDRGKQSALAVGRFMFDHDMLPDVILCSTAERTRRTLELVVSAAGWIGIPVRFEEELYLATPATALRVLETALSSVRSVLLVGHQPTLSGLVAYLTGGRMVDMPTACLATISIDLDGTGRLTNLVPPHRD